MIGVYILILALGAFFTYVAFSGTEVNYRQAVQALIFLALGSGGLAMNRPARKA